MRNGLMSLSLRLPLGRPAGPCEPLGAVCAPGVLCPTVGAGGGGAALDGLGWLDASVLGSGSGLG